MGGGPSGCSSLSRGLLRFGSIGSDKEMGVVSARVMAVRSEGGCHINSSQISSEKSSSNSGRHYLS
jgi:hypothetical protein